MLTTDLSWLRAVLGSAVASLPAPAVSLQPWLNVASAFPVQWKQIVKRFVTRVVEEHQVQFQYGIRTVFEDLEPLQEEPLACPPCPRLFGSRKGIGDALQACPRSPVSGPFFVLGSVCPVCHADFVTRPRVVGHLMRGALGCVLQWRLGALPVFSVEHV